MSWEKSLKISPSSYDDFLNLAEKRLPTQLFGYITGGAFREETLRRNRSQWEQITLRQQVLTDVASVNCETQLFDQALDFPLLMAPVGLAGLFARRAEAVAAKIAQQFKLPFVLSNVGICSIEEVMEAGGDYSAFQLYLMKDRGFCRSLLQRVWNAGCKTLFVTVDMPMLAERYDDHRNGVSVVQANTATRLKKSWDLLSHPKWLWNVGVKGAPLVFANLQQAVPQAKRLEDFKRWIDSQFDASLTWRDVEWIKTHWPGRLLVKGIMNAEDAERALEHGADALVVSNHGGRQLDGALSSIEVLPRIAETINRRIPVIVDSGIQNGTDVFRAIALGADACMIGRGWVLALAAAGESGLRRYLKNMKKELSFAMALTGSSDLADINLSRLQNFPQTSQMTE